MENKTMAMGHTTRDCTKFFAKVTTSPDYYVETHKRERAADARSAARRIAKPGAKIELWGLSKTWNVWTHIETFTK